MLRAPGFKSLAPETPQGLQKEEGVLQGFMAMENPGKGIAQGHCLPVRPPSSCTEPSALSWAVRSCRKAQITQSLL